MADPDLRELIRDFFLNQRFRRDVFVRGAGRMGDADRARRLAESIFDLQRPEDMVEYSMVTEAGRVQFDNRAAHAIVAALADGPKRLVDIAVEGLSSADLLANALVLFAADEIRPVGPARAEVAKLNEVIVGARALPYVAVPCGTGFRLAACCAQCDA